MWNLVALALSPVVVLITYVYFNDRHEREPILLLIWAFVLGVFSVLPTLLFSFGWSALGFELDNQRLSSTFTYAFLVVACSEEVAKFIMLRLFLYRKRAFDEPYDGIMYTMMIGMGFAAVENLLYVFGQPTYVDSLTVGGWRAITAVPAHATFAILMGYYAGKAKFAKSGKTGWLFAGLLAAVVFHGAYDFFLMQKVVPGMVLGAFASLLVAVVLSVRAIRYHQRVSTHRVVDPPVMGEEDQPRW